MRHKGGGNLYQTGPTTVGCEEPPSWPGLPPSSELDLLLEACSNARQLSKLCDLLDRHPSELDMPIDYDPDIHGWPWEAGI